MLDCGYSVGGSVLISEALYQTRAVKKNHHKMGLIWRITFLAFRVKKINKSVLSFITHFDYFGLFQVQQHLCCLSWSRTRRRGPVSEMRWRINGSTRDMPRNHSTLSPTKTGRDLLCLTCQHTDCQLKLKRVSRGNEQRHVILTVEFVHPVLMIPGCVRMTSTHLC